MAMKEVFIGIALAVIAALVVPAFAQTDTKSDSTVEQNDPGTGGQSKPGVQGLPGNKSGPAVKPGADMEKQNSGDDQSPAAGSDNSKVPGLPGNKSGSSQENPD
jgi:hypothetical protein